MRLPPKKRPGNPILASDWNLLIDALVARTPRPSHGMEIVSSSGGFSYRLRQVGGGDVTQSEACPFGQIIAWKDGETSKTGISGGVIHCGDQNWNMDNDEIDLATAGAWLVYFSVSCSVNMDDDNSILLPGVETGSKPSWSRTVWSEGTDYPDNSNPSVPGGTGTVILPVGKLTVTIPEGSPPGTKGTAKIEAAGCGSFAVTHCNGTLGYSRA